MTSEILDYIKTDGPQAVILRHAERHQVPSLTVGESLIIALTEKGKRDALELGKAIEGIDRIRLFHSPAVRCRETAECIAQGFASIGGKVDGVEETWDLCAPYLRDNEVLKEADRLGYGFMRAWFDGRFDPESISPTPQAADMVLGPILGGLSERPEKSLDLHISHDWELVLLREELFGVRYEDAGWIEYLEGIHFSRNGSGFVVTNRGHSSTFHFSEGSRNTNIKR